MGVTLTFNNLNCGIITDVLRKNVKENGSFMKSVFSFWFEEPLDLGSEIWYGGGGYGGRTYMQILC